MAASGVAFDLPVAAQFGVAFSASKAAIVIPVNRLVAGNAFGRWRIFMASPPPSLALLWRHPPLQIPVAAAAVVVHVRARAFELPFRRRASTERLPRPAPARSPRRTRR